MNTRITKQSTVTPMSTLTKSKPVGQGVKNIGKGKGSKPMSMGMKTAKNAAYEGANEGMQDAYSSYMSKSKNKGTAMQMGTGAAAGAGMPRFAMKKTVSKVGSGPASPKPKAKMLPEVTVTAPKPQKRFALKITSRKKG
jgi:hypothetical protein